MNTEQEYINTCMQKLMSKIHEAYTTKTYGEDIRIVL